MFDELCALPVADLAARDSALFLWATFPQLPEALRLIKEWGFTYKSVAFVWLKKNKKADKDLPDRKHLHPLYRAGRCEKGGCDCRQQNKKAGEKPQRVRAGRPSPPSSLSLIFPCTRTACASSPAGSIRKPWNMRTSIIPWQAPRIRRQSLAAGAHSSTILTALYRSSFPLSTAAPTPEAATSWPSTPPAPCCTAPPCALSTAASCPRATWRGAPWWPPGSPRRRARSWATPPWAITSLPPSMSSSCPSSSAPPSSRPSAAR